MKKLRLIGTGVIALSTVFITGFFFDKEEGGKSAGIQPQTMADALHKVMAADRTVYTKYIIARLANKEKVIKANEHWEDEKALVLPAQMFRYGSEMVAESNPGFSYSRLSLWPVNAQNKPKTDIEIKGLNFVAENSGKIFIPKKL